MGCEIAGWLSCYVTRVCEDHTHNSGWVHIDYSVMSEVLISCCPNLVSAFFHLRYEPSVCVHPSGGWCIRSQQFLSAWLREHFVRKQCLLPFIEISRGRKHSCRAAKSPVR